MQIKLFLGIKVTPDLKYQLNELLEELKLIPYEGKEFIGFYLEETEPNLILIKAAKRRCLELLHQLFPDHRIDTLPFVIFPQLFLG